MSPKKTDRPKAFEEPSPESKPKILIVEDDADLREALTDALEDTYTVITAGDGKDGLEKTRLCSPDIIVSDIMMPILDGVSLLREIKASADTAHIPFILLTARASVESQIQGLGDGADDYIPKPFVMGVLEARIENLLKLRKRLLEQFRTSVAEGDFRGTLHASENRFLDRLMSVLNEYGLEQELDSEALAGYMSMSLRSFQRKLKSEANQTPASVIRDYRINYAARELLSSDKSVTEIGYEVGYADSSHFARVFREVHGLSPSDYREKHTF